MDDQAFQPPVQPVAYQTNLRALAKWSRLNLTGEVLEDGSRRYDFSYAGSTCHSGGKVLEAVMHAVLRPQPRGWIFERGWIEVDPQDRGVRTMCAMATYGDEFLEILKKSPAFAGHTLEEILTAQVPTNPAGCFCSTPMRNHKWLQMLSTIHFVLFNQTVAAHDPDPNEQSNF